ncbi:MAG TPA: hypothetical protein VK922_03365 [Gemmatimonadaceae bacterium]|nr:hypothetical protein [Gemmatimonadaceae bacterium]
MRPRTIPFAVLASGFIACACVRPSLDELPVNEYAGHYTFGASSSWFWACGAAAADSSWATFTDRAVAQRDSIQRTGALSTGERHFVRWRAAVTSSGEVGPRGPGVPALLVREILVMRPPAAGDCR